MNASDVRKVFLQRLGVRIGPEMSEYVSRRLAAGQAAPGAVAVIGGDARTGIPVRTFVDPAKVLAGEDHPEVDPSDPSSGTLLH